jgi:hypothetical protein
VELPDELVVLVCNLESVLAEIVLDDEIREEGRCLETFVGAIANVRLNARRRGTDNPRLLNEGSNDTTRACVQVFVTLDRDNSGAARRRGLLTFPDR